MTSKRIYLEDLGVTAQVSVFAPAGTTGTPAAAGVACPAGVAEMHAMLHVEPRGELFGGQLARLAEAERRLLESHDLSGAQVVARRCFMSDATGQRAALSAAVGAAGATDGIGQPPLDGSKLAVWLYLQRGAGIRPAEGHTEVSRGGLTHLYHAGLTSAAGADAASQTDALLQAYEATLAQHGTSLAGGCVRTWFAVRDIDMHYAGLVRARRSYFAAHGLTPSTHYVASTGIGGLPPAAGAIVQMSAYAVAGLRPGQCRYLRGEGHMSRTDDYGVTFERGTAVAYGDRTHLYLSGTASIGPEGQVLYEGDIVRQVERVWAGVGALLAEGGATERDLMQVVVYLRDPSDYAIALEMFGRRYPGVPCAIVLAPVCRPAWLVEMECMAVTPTGDARFAAF